MPKNSDLWMVRATITLSPGLPSVRQIASLPWDEPWTENPHQSAPHSSPAMRSAVARRFVETRRFSTPV